MAEDAKRASRVDRLMDVPPGVCAIATVLAAWPLIYTSTLAVLVTVAGAGAAEDVVVVDVDVIAVDVVD